MMERDSLRDRGWWFLERLRNGAIEGMHVCAMFEVVSQP